MNNQRVEIVTRSVANPDEVPLRMIIETTDAWHRNWLNKHLDWAVRTGRSVAIYPTDAAVTFVTTPLDTSRRSAYKDRRPVRVATNRA